ncbi:MAG TPA: hypothetical protein VIH99_04670 [Bdellovibrionota bacterium]|jgi:hypothetical protein
MGNTALKLPQENHPLHAVPTVSGGHAPRALLSPLADIFMVGGGSLIFFFVANMFVSHQAPSSEVGWFIFNLSFFANFPHFLSSYHMLYGDFRRHIFTKARYFWAGVVAPALIVATIVYGFYFANKTILSGLINSMFFFVGWHYVKQTFGGMVVSNAINKIYYSKTERWAIKANLFSLWFLSWVSSNLSGEKYDYEGVEYFVMNVPVWLNTVALAIVGVTALWAIGTHVKKYLDKGGNVITAPAFACWASLYAWYLPSLYHPTFFQMVPFFHSLQYLLFVVAFRKNKAAAGGVETPAQRRRFLFEFYGQLGFMAVTGAAFMWFLPHWIDGKWPNAMIPTAVMFSATIFINVHHYFIDNVLWRSDNEEMKRYLFS